MSLGTMLGTMIRTLDHKLGLQSMLNGEPRPPAGGFDLKGEKHLDWGFICANLPAGPKRALEIGSGQSPIVPAMLALGYDVLAVDLCADISNRYGGFHFVKGDFMDLQLEVGFDVIIACSAVEHIGLPGRYGSKGDPDGDLKAMRKIWKLLAPEGSLFLTVPVGRDAIYLPWHRVYGRERMPRLMEGFDLVRSRYLIKKPQGPWHSTDRDTALDYPVTLQRYALGEMVLRKVRTSA